MRVDSLEHTFRPILGKVGIQISFLYCLTESINIGFIYIEAFSLEEIDQFGFFLQN